MTEPSLAGFLNLTGANFSCFDLSVQLKKLPKSTLVELDSGKAYPFPHLNFAWLVILLWNPENKAQNSFWFLKLPLDEQGQLSPGVHSDLVNRLYRSVQTQDEKERQRLLTDHPYQFTPNEEKKAALHAQSSKLLGSKESQFCAQAIDFYTDPNVTAAWQSLGLQGISDMLVRLSDAQEQAFNKRIPTLASEPFIALLHQMEHTQPSIKTVEAVLSRNAIYTDCAEMIAAIRGVSQAKANKLVRPLIKQGLSFFPNNLELLLAIITRYPHWMAEVDFSVPILDQLAQSTDQKGFHKIIHHLAILPGSQGIVMTLLGAPNITPALANALSSIIQQHRAHQHHVH